MTIRFEAQGGAAMLGAAMTCQIGAVILTPTPVRRWIARSYFGRDDSLFSLSHKRDDMFPKGGWKAEFDGLQTALKEATK